MAGNEHWRLLPRTTTRNMSKTVRCASVSTFPFSVLDLHPTIITHNQDTNNCHVLDHTQPRHQLLPCSNQASHTNDTYSFPWQITLSMEKCPWTLLCHTNYLKHYLTLVIKTPLGDKWSFHYMTNIHYMHMLQVLQTPEYYLINHLLKLIEKFHATLPCKWFDMHLVVSVLRQVVVVVVAVCKYWPYNG